MDVSASKEVDAGGARISAVPRPGQPPVWRSVLIRLAPGAVLGLVPPALLAYGAMATWPLLGLVLAGLAAHGMRLRAMEVGARHRLAAEARNAAAAMAEHETVLAQRLAAQAEGESTRTSNAMNRMRRRSSGS
jgi:hypothetical protein